MWFNQVGFVGFQRLVVLQGAMYSVKRVFPAAWCEIAASREQPMSVSPPGFLAQQAACRYTPENLSGM
jgi:hypothetical protein